MKRSKNKLTLVLAILSAICLTVSSMAYLTDRIDANIEAVAGTLDLQIVDPGFVASKTEDLKPGEGIVIEFTLTNAGSKSADVLETLVLCSDVALSAITEFDLYAREDVTLDANGVVTAIAAGAEPVAVRTVSADRKQIQYAIPEFILSGTGSGAEIEKDGAGNTISSSKTSSYVLVFREGAGNTFQNISLKLFYEAQAKQHRNTNESTWALVKTKEITFAGNKIQSVPVQP